MLLDSLIRRQEERGESDAEFAAFLGLARSTWQLTRTRRVPLGVRVARAARAAFPDLESQVIGFLLSTDATAMAHVASGEQAAV